MAENGHAQRAGEPPAARSSQGLGRRRLLQGMANGGGVLAVVGTAGETMSSGPGADAVRSAEDHTRLGFDVTEHVGWYYARARW